MFLFLINVQGISFCFRELKTLSNQQRSTEQVEVVEKKKKRKSVSFKPDDSLVEIRYFDSNHDAEHVISFLLNE